jgi:sulfur carrier protein ThiS
MASITVSVGTVPGTMSNVALEEGATVQEAIRHAGFSDPQKYRIEIDGETVGLDHELSNGDAIALLKNVAAG